MVACNDPRGRLLWSIVGQATSTDWKRPDPATSQQGRSLPAEQAEASQPPPETAGALWDCLPSEETAARAERLTLFSASERDRAATGDSESTVAWTELPLEIVPLLARSCGHSFCSATALALSGVCRSWRDAVLGDAATLAALPCSRMTWTARTASADHCMKRAVARDCMPPPAIACKASLAGNVSISTAAARALDNLQCLHEAMKYWARAARAGDPCSQVILGKAHYLGEAGIGLDAEEALRYLSKGMKALLHLTAAWPADSLGTTSSASKAASSTSAASRTASAEGSGFAIHSAGSQPPLRQQQILCARAESDEKRCPAAEVLRMGAFMLGLLHLDGEGSKADAGEAVKWLRIAEQYGSCEAPAVLGTLFNTGQYG